VEQRQTEAPDATAVRVALWRGRTDGLRPATGEAFLVAAT
jgi:hypothetical protein